VNDDDDEIRDLAAITTTHLLRSWTGDSTLAPVIPILSTQRIALFLAHNFVGSKHLHKEALRRLILTPIGGHVPTRPFAAMLANERKEETALFAREKQNLFKDETADAAFWSRVLKLVSPPGKSSVLVKEFRAWVVAALSTLIQATRGEEDGPLGWTSKPEVFALGIRVICAVEE
jgi:hypothetical protein